MRPLGPEDIFSPPKFSFLVIARGPGFDFSRAFLLAQMHQDPGSITRGRVLTRPEPSEA